MWKMTFVNQYGVVFTAFSGEDGVGTDADVLEYIQYCTDANSILIKMEEV